MAETDGPSGSQSLLRGLQLIEILSNYANGCPLAKLAELANLNKSTTHRLLQGLESAGYVTHAPTPGSYRLTTKFIAVGNKALSSLNVIHVAAPHLEALNIETEETVNFSMLENDHAIMIYKMETTTGMLRTRAYIGQHLTLYCSAMGKIFLAYGPEENFERYWEKIQPRLVQYTTNTITSLDRMKVELAEIREHRLAFDREENELGVSCIAAPVFNINGDVKYSVSVSLSTVKLAQIGIDQLAAAVGGTARRIGQEVGAS
jgi:IclR family transcriptional regulator, carbohydrate utilization repressor